ncbi:hypothetical protein BMF35_a0446 [Aurantiacibacter gangjinensis]|nr:hypothetical protein BMF35_a0446 [Aurantiacibacter gangjinensis]
MVAFICLGDAGRRGRDNGQRGYGGVSKQFHSGSPVSVCVPDVRNASPSPRKREMPKMCG